MTPKTDAEQGDGMTQKEDKANKTYDDNLRFEQEIMGGLREEANRLNIDGEKNPTDAELIARSAEIMGYKSNGGDRLLWIKEGHLATVGNTIKKADYSPVSKIEQAIDMGLEFGLVITIYRPKSKGKAPYWLKLIYGGEIVSMGGCDSQSDCARAIVKTVCEVEGG